MSQVDTPAVHPDALDLARLLMPSWPTRSALIPAWHPRNEDPPAGDPPAGDPPAGDPPADDQKFDRSYVEQLRRENAAARKRAQEAEARAKEFEDRDKTETQRAADARQKAEREATDAKAEALRARVALKHKLPEDLIDRLRGTTQEELEADAKALLKLVRTDDAPPTADGGARGSAPKGSFDDDIRRAAGRAT